MEKRYHLPITLLLTSTKGVSQELSFQTRLPPQRISKEECVVQLRVRDGVMLTCEIKPAPGGSILFQQEQAIDALKPLGMLEWYRTPPPAFQIEGTHEPPSLAGQSGDLPAPILEPIPVRRRLTGESPSLDHFHRRVLLLVDGTRSSYQIAILLTKNQEEVLSILYDLQNRGLITF